MDRAPFLIIAITTAIALLFGASLFAQEKQSEFWDARNVTIDRSVDGKKVRIGVWDSGVDTALFEGRLALGNDGKPILRGYNAFKMREDTALSMLPAIFHGRQEELNDAMIVDVAGFDKMHTDETRAKEKLLNERISRMSPLEKQEFDQMVARWGGHTHGTAIADIVIAGIVPAEILIARMQWWHGKPPVPCWTKELADREADSIGDLLAFLVKNGSRVVNMSWGRFEGHYLRNLRDCAPEMNVEDRQWLARYTVDKIRQVLIKGMASAPNVLFVGAAGNDGSTMQKSNPATLFLAPNFILVGAVDHNGKRMDLTNTGPEVGIYANGFRVPTRLPGGAILPSTGTSMAAPNVANAAAKMLAVNPKLTGAQLKSIILNTADTNETGDRLLHTAKAVTAARSSTKVSR